ncbi:MAG: HipA domain-containing protein [Bifidobacteriaceae bacterium]|jgi:serine/threonine-protein kinase HipA|nr:HipA domain-containing protein [Bifidobacteriaceae bacterium]
MAASATRQVVEVCLGAQAVPVGSLTYALQGRREYSAFSYDGGWLSRPDGFNVSADLQFLPGYQPHKAATERDSVFFGALADTEPDTWGRRVIARAHAKRRAQDASLGPLTEIDHLLAVDDFSRVGALRLRVAGGSFRDTAAEGRRRTPPLLELAKIIRASQLVEAGQETAEDLRYLQGKGTSLGGMRPKCTLIDRDGGLAIGKFPSVGDQREVTRAEVLALRLARLAGVDAAQARLELVGESPVAIIRRFDRTADGGRIPYQSAASWLAAPRDDERSYGEIADALRAHGQVPVEDCRQLWRRLALNLLITNVDDHLLNMGFLHVANGQWRLAPAFDLNPFPDKAAESKTWLTEEDGPVSDVGMLLGRAALFDLTADMARLALGQVVAAVGQWRTVALSRKVGLTPADLDELTPAFDHNRLREAVAAIG